MSVETALTHGRAAAERLMVDTVEVRPWDGSSRTLDTTTGENVKDVGEPIYGPTVDTDEGRNGRARVQQQRSVSDEDQGGGRTVTVLRRELQLPMTATGFKVDYIATVVESQDPDLVGREFRVASLFGKTHATARRVAIEEVTS